MKHSYQDFADQIDLDALYEDIGWEPLRTQGGEDIGHCLFPENHNNGDRTGKFAINREKKVANCWVCGGFSLPELLAQIWNVAIQEAVERLYTFAQPGERSSQAFYEEVDQLLERHQPKKQSLPFFNQNVLSKWGLPDEEWLRERHIAQDVAEYFKLRFDPHHERDRRKSATIIFPHLWEGKLVGWQERWLDGQKPKYTNTKGFPRERTLWGYDFCKQQEKAPIVVESVPTALYLISEGYPSIATFGAEVTQEQIRLLRVFHKGLILAPDNDIAGNKWLERLSTIRSYAPIFHVPSVYGLGADLSDLEPEDLTLHLKAVSYFIPFT